MAAKKSEKEKVIRVANVGLGARGCGMMTRFARTLKNVQVVAVCDLYEDRAEKGREAAQQLQPDIKVDAYTDYKKIIERDDIDAVVVTTSWDDHVRIAAEAMYSGKYAGIECGGGGSVNECQKLVRAYEQTGKWCMSLENCCYDRKELALLRMIREGVFGELTHFEGGYLHDLRDEIAHGIENRHYRHDNYVHRCADFYPGHALGPIMKFADINRGNRLVTLTSFASKAAGLHEYCKNENPSSADANRRWLEGDVVQTFIRCAHGETILMTHDTSSPRGYSRGLKVQGSRGIYSEESGSLYLDNKGEVSGQSFSSCLTSDRWGHPLYDWYEKQNVGDPGGHGPMDWMVISAFIEAIRRGIEPPIDTYDTATLLCVTALSEESCALGGQTLPIPDFTDGKWINRSPAPASVFSLDRIDKELFEM